MWRLKEGQTALALFLTADSAAAYHKAAGLGDEWKVYRPARPALFQLVNAAVQAGMPFAVLDPDLEKAKRVFDLQAMLSGLDVKEALALAVETASRENP